MFLVLWRSRDRNRRLSDVNQFSWIGTDREIVRSCNLDFGSLAKLPSFFGPRCILPMLPQIDALVELLHVQNTWQVLYAHSEYNTTYMHGLHLTFTSGSVFVLQSNPPWFLFEGTLHFFSPQQIRLSVHVLHLTSDSNRDTFRLAFSCLLQEGKRAQNLNSSSHICHYFIVILIHIACNIRLYRQLDNQTIVLFFVFHLSNLDDIHFGGLLKSRDCWQSGSCWISTDAP